MPLRKVKGGWMWGSKGPFPTKAKALAVARAAYASGYRENDNTNHLRTNKQSDALYQQRTHAQRQTD